jgi:hypothetical protein
MKIVPTSKRVEIALITGEMPNLTIENICNGKVVELGPATKNVMTKSSIERVKRHEERGNNPGERYRYNHFPKCDRPCGTQVVCRFDYRLIEVLEPCEDNHHRVRNRERHMRYEYRKQTEPKVYRCEKD